MQTQKAVGLVSALAIGGLSVVLLFSTACALLPGGGILNPSALEGEWRITQESGDSVLLNIDSRGQVTSIIGENSDGLIAAVIPTDSNSDVDGSDVVIEVELAGTVKATIVGAISTNEQSIVGTIDTTVVISDNLNIVLPSGQIVLVRVPVPTPF